MTVVATHSAVRTSVRVSDIDPEQKIQIRGLTKRYDVTSRTIDRWLLKPHLDFPKPVMLVHDASGRVSHRYWRLGDLEEWDRRQAVSSADRA
ncbi:hypothetical protein [Bradyrhizobium sp. BR 10261]|uniref:hypothetical protein n=1 Tax=Bradyrhizobium sp. BR 10261 TaxID=2749992 RepID=UPI001C64E147|nr:hypothetical protein [Bradyrhizobium sp. BR 10261]MBW7964948.1 hypothetical protein [Bradyrhizobium sp. BR 10261]